MPPNDRPRPRRRAALTLSAVALAIAGCGGGGGGASHPPLPRVVTLGGPVLTAPKVLPIVYASDSGAADLQAFLQELSGSPAWGQATAEYGVGPLTVLPAVTMTTAAPPTISDSVLQATLAANTTGSSPPWGAADPQTIYLFVLPQGSIEQDSTGTGCTDFDGYHSEARAGGLAVPYALSCACPGFDGPSVTDLQERTVGISHELIEAATDPFPSTMPAYVQEDDADIVWTLVTDGEVADMCEFNDDANVVPPGATYMIQRSWSNAAAARGENPCVPVVTSAPYLNSFPAVGTIVDGAIGNFQTQGVKVPIGGTSTIAVKLFSAAATDNTWTVRAYDYDADVLGTSAPGLALSLDQATGRNGDVIHLTVSPAHPDAQLGGEAFILVSDYGQPGDPDFESQITMGLVTN